MSRLADTLKRMRARGQAPVEGPFNEFVDPVKALAPLRGRLPRSKLRRLVLALRSACGIEALVWLTDVAGLSRRQAGELMRWSALALLREALADGDGRASAR